MEILEIVFYENETRNNSYRKKNGQSDRLLHKMLFISYSDTISKYSDPAYR